MTGGVGDTFAIIPATIAKAGGVATVSFNLDPKLFTDPGNKPMILGIDVAPNQSSTANPVVTSVVAPNGKSLPVTRATFDPKVTRTGVSASSTQSTAALVTVPGISTDSLKAKSAKVVKGAKATAAAVPAGAYTYKVNVSGLNKTTGSILVGFYLPGNAGGGGVVNQADINATKYALNTTASDTTGKYSFDADANRNGVIDQTDMMIAQKNLGVGTTISPVISANLDSTGVADPTNRVTNNPTVHITGTATPNATVTYSLASGYSASTIADATGAYSITLNLLQGANTFNVVATDAFNQKITGSIASITYTPKA